LADGPDTGTTAHLDLSFSLIIYLHSEWQSQRLAPEMFACLTRCIVAIWGAFMAKIYETLEINNSGLLFIGGGLWIVTQMHR
jgi:hypothetical protein